jgi:hypothetical protein
MTLRAVPVIGIMRKYAPWGELHFFKVKNF